MKNTKREKIKKFVDTLAKAKATKHSVNHYSYGNPANNIRRKNLIAYLETMSELGPEILLVGEAPGYRGTRLSGVPFSSEKILTTHPFYVSKKDFNIEHPENPTAESSASIVWRAFDEIGVCPLIWASFPFHPHKPGNHESNRAPTKEELEFGKKFLLEIIKLFEIKEIIAVGRAAEKTLGDLGIPATHIRHPSHGGANLFKSGLKKFVESRKKKK